MGKEACSSLPDYHSNHISASRYHWAMRQGGTQKPHPDSYSAAGRGLRLQVVEEVASSSLALRRHNRETTIS